ncbi:MAG: SH3 domain-containing protein [Leptospiraceae bacterium]|nr:SH3 domain-containing protein [Leptospiraceae bacterium]
MDVYVTAPSGLLIRSEPATSARKVGLAPHGSKLTALDQSDTTMLIQGKTGKWTRVVFEDSAGWSFGGFLSARKPAAIGQQAQNTNMIIRCENWDQCQTKCYENQGQIMENGEPDPAVYDCYDACTRKAGGREYVDANCNLGC